MTTQMMKAPPKFETCLFGPSGTPIPIKAYDYEETTEIVNIASDNSVNEEGDAAVIVSDDAIHGANSPTVNSDGREDDETRNEATPPVVASHESQDEPQSKDTAGPNQSTGNDPPQTPTKSINQSKTPTPPSRPAKVITRTQPTHNNHDGKKQSSATKPFQHSTTNPASKSSSSSSSSSSPPPLPATTKKTQQKSNRIGHHTINLQELRRLSSQGVPDDCSYRPLAWRILLGYLPLDTNKWQTVLDRDRLLYRTLVKELFVYSQDHDYPFELEGRKLVGKGLNRDGKRGDYEKTSHDHDYKVNQLRNRYGERRNDDPNGVNDEKTNDGEQRADNNNHDSNVDNEMENNEEFHKEEKNIDRGIEDENDDEENHEHESISESTITQDEIPYEVKEQWRKSGRDPDSLLAGMGKTISGRFVNALLVTNNDTASTKSNDMDRTLYLTKSLEGDYDPKWRHFLENASLLDEIRKDVVRTHPDLKFFLEPEDNLGSRRYAAIERILFVWAKLNKGVRYVQGMNEIVGTLYFVLANDENEEWACEAEADTYFLFNTLMVEMRDIFVPDLDEADTGIQGRMANMISLLSLHDPEVRCHLDDCHIDPGFYSIRWLTTLLSREFLLPDTIRLWDSMFASTHKDNFMRYVCVCMVMVIREDLLKGDFGTCLRLLQSYPPTNVDQLLESSRALWIYESQVTLACHKGGISLTQALSTIAPPPAVLMAYGLQGGVAVEQVGQTRQDMQQFGDRRMRANGRLRRGRSPSNTSNVTASAAAKSILGFLGLNNS